MTEPTSLVKRETSSVAERKTLIDQVKELYVDTAGYPPESVMAIVQSVETIHSNRAILANQLKLPYEVKRDIIHHRREDIPSAGAMVRLEQFAKDNNITLDMIDWIPSMGPYPSTEARQSMLNMDKRGLKNVESELVEILNEHGDTTAIFRCRITFWDGSTFGWCMGSASKLELGAKRKEEVSLHNVITMAETRAFNRAAFRASNYFGGAIEEYDIDDNAPTKTTVSTEVVKPAEPQNVGELMSAALRMGMDAGQVKEILGVVPTSLTRKEIPGAWAKLSGGQGG